MVNRGPRPALAWHRRLEARVAAAIAVLVALALGALPVATTKLVTERSLGRGTEDLGRVLTTTADDYLREPFIQKPFSMEPLAAKIREAPGAT